MISAAIRRRFAVLVAAGHPVTFVPGFVATVLAAIHHVLAMTGMIGLLLLFARLLAMRRMSGVRIGGRLGLRGHRRGDDERHRAQERLQHFISP